MNKYDTTWIRRKYPFMFARKLCDFCSYLRTFCGFNLAPTVKSLMKLYFPILCELQAECGCGLQYQTRSGSCLGSRGVHCCVSWNNTFCFDRSAVCVVAWWIKNFKSVPWIVGERTFDPWSTNFFKIWIILFWKQVHFQGHENFWYNLAKFDFSQRCCRRLS